MTKEWKEAQVEFYLNSYEHKFFIFQRFSSKHENAVLQSTNTETDVRVIEYFKNKYIETFDFLLKLKKRAKREILRP